LLEAQARAVLDDMPVAAIKLGMLASPELIDVVIRLMSDWPDLPVVLDPVLAGGGGGSLSRQDMASHLRASLLGRVTLATPNGPELQALAPETDSPAAAAALLSRLTTRAADAPPQGQGPTAILATGGHEPGHEVVNTLWQQGLAIDRQSWPRLPEEYHGSGCTLASACAAFLAQGLTLTDSIRRAQHFTWHALSDGRALGRGQRIPRRLPVPDGTSFLVHVEGWEG
jgi:hydroxymethylpyrimidine/phosphomethylpyrimidine kinase